MDKSTPSTKRYWLTLAACIALAGGLTATWTWTSTPVEAAADEDTPLMKAMEIVGSRYKKIRRQARAKKFDETTIKMVQEMQMQSLVSMHEPLPMAQKAPEDKKKQMIIGYKKSMAALVKMLMDLEILLEEGKFDQAAKVVMEDLAASKKEGHDLFIEEE